MRMKRMGTVGVGVEWIVRWAEVMRHYPLYETRKYTHLLNITFRPGVPIPRTRARKRPTHIGPPQKRKQFSTSYKIHNHVQIREILEGAPEVDDERVLHGEEQSLLVVRVVHLTHPDDFFFVEYFDSVESEVVF